tara:strand:- start:124 stop:507 length:384 start_codon:yes stop_codon:yes gene_type:complete
MARIVTNRLDTGCDLDASGTTAVLPAGTGITGAPSGTTGIGTFPSQGIAWAHINCTTVTAACTIAVYVYRAGAWYFAAGFGSAGSQVVPLGAYSYDLACLGADYVNVRVVAVTTGTITVSATLSQDV